MPNEPTVLDALALATAVADDLLVATARDTHEAIARRVHGAVRLGTGPAGRPAEVLHRNIAGAVYGALGLGLRTASRGLDAAAATGRGAPLEAHPAGRFLNAAVNGLIGEELSRERPALAIEMSVRRDGSDVVLTPDGVAAAFPEPGGRLVVWLHGLCEHEGHWERDPYQRGRTYADDLAAEGWTSVHVRANTGLGVRPNGVALAAVLQRLVDAWPVPVEQIALVGHSMGGLIARTALAVRATSQVGSGVGSVTTDWSQLVSDVVTLGTPHLGAPLARGADLGVRVLRRLPESTAFGTVIDRRSIGIRDLQLGVADAPPDDVRVRYRLVSASLSASPRHPVARVLGDLLVTPDSANARGRDGAELFPDAERLHVGRVDHFGLLNHPQVAAALCTWLRQPAPRAVMA